MTDQSQPAIEAASAAATAAAATAGNKLTMFSGTVGLLVSWIEGIPTGMVLSIAGIVLGLGINAFFRWLGHRRDSRLRMIEHEAYMRRLAERDTAGAPLS